MQSCKKIILENVEKGSTVIVSCSGGPDSMCLLKNVIDLKDKLDLKIIVGHINHNVREESLEEELFVKDYALKNDLIFESMTIKKYTKENFHNEARIIRYDFMKELIKKYQASYLFTAHHGDDLMETILMRIARGSNLKGYAGFRAVMPQDGYVVIRPLILTTKEEIIKYNNENGILFAIDKTNASDDYTRNRYRNHMLPFLKAENTDIHLKYWQYSERLNENNEFVEKYVQNIEQKIIVDNKLIIKDFKNLESLIQKRIIENMLYKIYLDDLYTIGLKHVSIIIEFILKNKNGYLNLPGNYIAVCEYGYFYINAFKENTEYCYELENVVYLPNNYKLSLTNEVGDSNYYLKLNSKEVKLPLYVRNKKEGDKIEVKHLNGTQKVKKIFIDYKVNKNDRASWPVVVDSNNTLLWVPGLKKSKFDKEINEIYDIIIKYEEENDE